MPLLQRVNRSTAIAIGVAIAALAGPAHAQPKNFPNKPVRFVTTGPGSQNDLVARKIIAQKMGESWGQSIVIENRTGAGGTIGAAIVAKATPDGHTLFLAPGVRGQRCTPAESSLRPRSRTSPA